MFSILFPIWRGYAVLRAAGGVLLLERNSCRKAEALSGEAEPSPRRKPRRVVGGTKRVQSYLFLPFVCLYFDNLHRNLRRFRRCVFSGFVYSPARRENCAVGERRSRRPSGALFWRAFSADERRLWAYFARNGPSLCHLQTIQRPRVRRRLMFSFTNGPARQPPFAFVLAAQPWQRRPL